MRRFFFILICITLPLLLLSEEKVSEKEENKLPEEALTILNKATQIELFSIDPTSDKTEKGFHGYSVLGKTIVKDDAKKELIEAFQKGFDSEIEAADCFKPRHAIRSTFEGKTVDITICFECLRCIVFLPEPAKPKHLKINSGKAMFDKILKDAGITKAK